MMQVHDYEGGHYCVPSELERRNAKNVARYYGRKAAQGGSKFLMARDLEDLRTDEQRQRWRAIVVLVRHRKRELANKPSTREWLRQLGLKTMPMFLARQAN